MADIALRVSDGQTLKLAAATPTVSTNSIPLSVARDLAAGGVQVGFNLAITEAVATGAGNVTIEVIGADNAALNSGVISLGYVVYLASELVLNKTFYIALPIQRRGTSTMKKFLGLRYQVSANNAAGTGAVTAEMGYERKEFYAYPKI